MATLAFDPPREEPASEYRFAATMAMVMAVVVVAGFSTQFLLGRSTFASPPRVHFHAVVFMGWVAIFVTQSWLATRGPIALHRKLGWIAAGWMVFMVTAALMVIVAVVQNGTAPFFFRPQEFLLANPLTLLGFVGLTGAAIAMRKRTDWHARLHICGMTMIMGPAFGRLLPMPLLIPYAFESAGLAASLFPVAGMIRDKRKLGVIHPAWWYGLGTMAIALIIANLLAAGPVGDWLYRSVVAGTPGAAVPGMEFAPAPGTPLRTGR